MIKSVHAQSQSIPTPSVPEFTVKLVDHSYDVPPVTTSTTNPYNNKTTTTTIPSYRIRNVTIDLTIVNQPYPASINGNASFVYYDVQLKGHFGQGWTELFQYYDNSPVQSNSQYTVISLPDNYQVGDQIDIQVQAAIGYKIVTYIAHPPEPNVYTESVDFQHASSDWSPTQTFTIPASSASASPTSTPTIPEASYFAIEIYVLILLGSLIIAYVNTSKPKAPKKKCPAGLKVYPLVFQSNASQSTQRLFSTSFSIT